MTAPNRNSACCLPIAAWPTCDQGRWKAALAAGDVLDPGGVASRWSAATRRKVISGWGRFLCWLRENGELDPVSTPESRITRERLSDYLDHLRQMNHGHTVHCRIQEVGDALRALAPDGDWRWIRRAAGRLRASTVPARDKHARFRPIQELIARGFALMNEAETANGLSDLDRAVIFRDGLIIALLGFNPMRLRNLAELSLDRRLVERGDGFWLQLRARQTKGRQPLEGQVADRLVEPLRRYLQHYRPILLGRDRARRRPPTDRLWIAETGAPLGDEWISKRIARWTASEGKPPVSPHMFRTCARTTVAICKPESIEIMRGVLGHSTSRMGEQHYDLARGVEASRAYGAVLDELYRELAPKRRRPRHRNSSLAELRQTPGRFSKFDAKH